MASPIAFHVLASTGIKIKLLPKAFLDEEGIDSNSNSQQRRYEIINPIKDLPLLTADLGIFEDDIIEGYSSPTSKVNMPPAISEEKKIDRRAKIFVYLHPPAGLAAQIDWSVVSESYDEVIDDSVPIKRMVFDNNPDLSCIKDMNDDYDDDENKNEEEKETPLDCIALAYFSLLGGFAYLDENENFLHVNVIATSSNRKMDLDDKGRLKRPSMVSMDSFEIHPSKPKQLRMSPDVNNELRRTFSYFVDRKSASAGSGGSGDFGKQETIPKEDEEDENESYSTEFKDDDSLISLSASSTDSNLRNQSNNNNLLTLLGPFTPHPAALHELRAQYRRCIVTPVPTLHEAGYVSCAWVLPMEMFHHSNGNVPLLLEEGKVGGSIGGIQNLFGSFVFWRDRSFNPVSDGNIKEGESKSDEAIVYTISDSMMYDTYEKESVAIDLVDALELVESELILGRCRHDGKIAETLRMSKNESKGGNRESMRNFGAVYEDDDEDEEEEEVVVEKNNDGSNMVDAEGNGLRSTIQRSLGERVLERKMDRGAFGLMEPLNEQDSDDDLDTDDVVPPSPSNAYDPSSQELSIRPLELTFRDGDSDRTMESLIGSFESGLGSSFIELPTGDNDIRSSTEPIATPSERSLIRDKAHHRLTLKSMRSDNVLRDFDELGFSCKQILLGESSKSLITNMSIKQQRSFSLQNNARQKHRSTMMNAFRGQTRYQLLNHIDLTEVDEMGWTALHYACRFQPYDPDLISQMIEQCPTSLNTKDKFDRTPLHLFCQYAGRFNLDKADETATKDDWKRMVKSMGGEWTSTDNVSQIIHNSQMVDQTIDVLLRTDAGKQCARFPTKYLKYLPLHLALEVSASSKIITALVEVCPFACRKSSGTGYLPLHMALANKHPPLIIQTLLDADSAYLNQAYELKENVTDRSHFDYIRGRMDVHRVYRGLLPIHMACRNNSSPFTVKLLLNRDVHLLTVDAGINAGNTQNQKASSLDLAATLQMSRHMRDENENEDLSVRFRNDVGVLPLHFAAKHQSRETVGLLLNKALDKNAEMGIESIRRGFLKYSKLSHSFTKEPIDFLKQMVNRKDEMKRTPLHVACLFGADPWIVKMLVDSDNTGKVTYVEDNYHMTALHYVCGQKNCDFEVVRLLLEREAAYIRSDYERRADLAIEKYRTDEMNAFWEPVKPLKSAVTKSGMGKTPLYYAVENNAPTEVLDILLRPDYFYLNDLDTPCIEKLAERIKESSDLQQRIVDRLATRTFFSTLMFEFMVYVIAICALVIGTENWLTDQAEYWCPSLILLCVLFFCWREYIQIKSQSFRNYIFDVWSWVEVVLIVLLSFVSIRLIGHADEDRSHDLTEVRKYEKGVMMVSGSLLIIQYILFLRSTFLPFARFVGGVFLISKRLVPFFIVTILMLLLYYEAARLNEDNGNPAQNGTSPHEGKKAPDFPSTFGLFFYGELSEGGNNESTKRIVIEMVFGVLVLLVLLNVVIAVVAEAWDTASEEALSMYWKYRLEKITEWRVLGKRPTENPLLQWIDRRPNVRVQDNIPWLTHPPYNKVQFKKQYDYPKDYFLPIDAEKIEQGRSLQASLYWAKRDNQFLREKREKEKRRKGWQRNSLQPKMEHEEEKGKPFEHESRGKTLLLVVFLKWSCYLLLYIILLILGLCTAGLLWPKRFRIWVLSLGMEENDNTNVKMNDDSKKSSASGNLANLPEECLQFEIHARETGTLTQSV